MRNLVAETKLQVCCMFTAESGEDFFIFFLNERLTLFIMTFMSKCTAHLPDEKPTRKLLQDMEMVTKMRLVLFVCLFVCLLLFSINCKAQRSSCSLKPLHLNPVLK